MTLLAIPPQAIAAVLLLAVLAIGLRRRDTTFAIDLLFVALYWRYGAPVTLALIFAQAAARRVPTLAGQLMAWFGVETATGWTEAFLLFTMPGLRAFKAAPAGGASPVLPDPPVPHKSRSQASASPRPRAGWKET